MKNKYLELLLEKYNSDDDETWDSIAKNGGSVQHLDFLTDEHKDVFKTMAEISQKEILIQASVRQKYMDQGQSINILLHPKETGEAVSNLHYEAWQNCLHRSSLFVLQERA